MITCKLSGITQDPESISWDIDHTANPKLSDEYSTTASYNANDQTITSVLKMDKTEFDDLRYEISKYISKIYKNLGLNILLSLRTITQISCLARLCFEGYINVTIAQRSYNEDAPGYVTSVNTKKTLVNSFTIQTQAQPVIKGTDTILTCRWTKEVDTVTRDDIKWTTSNGEFNNLLLYPFNLILLNARALKP
eukprot:sb/3471046/